MIYLLQLCRTAAVTAFGSAISSWWWLQLVLGGVIPSLPTSTSLFEIPSNALGLTNAGVWIFWTMKRVSLGKPISSVRDSVHWDVLRHPDVLQEYCRGTEGCP